MASSWRLASMLLASWILLLYWTTSSAESYDLHPSTRFRRQLPFRTREQVQASSQVLKDTLTVIKEGLSSSKSKSVIEMMKSMSRIVNLAPGIGGAVASLINVVLAFFPQENPLAELRKGFDEVNRKLDSLSIQISNLATDVEWFNYASVYSQDEVRILNAWNKLNEFRESSELAKSEEEKLRLAEVFASYYESIGAEASVSNLYHYLTVNSTTLSGNLNDLLVRKFKCGLADIGRFNLYFSSLLWRGMVVSQVYWNLMGLYSSDRETEDVQMLKEVYKAQTSTMDFCLTNYERYMKDDVVEITKKLSTDKAAIAEQVKKALDEKYNWYQWVVLVYDSDMDSSYKLFDVTKIPVGNIMVVVAYTLKADREHIDWIKDAARGCFQNKPCEIGDRISSCIKSYSVPGRGVHTTFLTELAKVTHVSYNGGQSSEERPDPLEQVDCSWGYSGGKISVHWSRRMPVCDHNPCQNNAQCKRVLESNDWLCDCQDGYYGDTCNKKVDTSAAQDMKTLFPKPLLSTTSTKLRAIESKLDTLMSRCRCS